MEINLLPWRDEITAFNRTIFIRLMLIALILSAITLWFGYQLYFSQVSYSKSYLQALQEVKSNLSDKITTFLTQKKTQEEVIKRVAELEKLQRSRFETVRLLNEIVKITPKGIYLSKMERHDKQVEIIGTANSNLLIADYMKDINASPNLDVISLQKVEKTEGSSLVVTQFDLLMTLTMDPVQEPAAKPTDELHNPVTEILKMRDNRDKKIEDILNEGKK